MKLKIRKKPIEDVIYEAHNNNFQNIDIKNDSDNDPELLAFKYLSFYIKYSFIPWRKKGQTLIIAIIEPTEIDKIKLLYKNESLVFKLLAKRHMSEILQIKFAGLCLKEARDKLPLLSPSLSVKNLSPIISIILPLILIYSLMLYSPIFYLTSLCVMIGFSFITSLFKIFLFIKGIRTPNYLIKNTDIKEEDLPLYSIFIPLYKEEDKLFDIIYNMEKLDYPKDKLDIKIIIEGNDLATCKLAKNMPNLPSYFDLIIVPLDNIQTKPKALNYALNFARGEYLVIYDAEDFPSKMQLKQAIYKFSVLPDNYACVQSRLNFYNSSDNFITRLLSIEYSLWFDFILQGLDNFKLPVPLGGTSNHYKIKILKEVGGWDSYNVTEDADLGLRFSEKGYYTALIKNYTLEESLNSIKSWLYQRTRWIQGFLLTYLIITKRTKNFINSKKGIKDFIAIQLFISFSTFNVIFFPVIFFSYTFNYNNINYYIGNFAIGYIIFNWIIHFLMAMVSTLSYNRPFILKDLLMCFIFPYYFILHSIASYLALWQIIKNPFKWHKTKHGIYYDK